MKTKFIFDIDSRFCAHSAKLAIIDAEMKVLESIKNDDQYTEEDIAFLTECLNSWTSAAPKRTPDSLAREYFFLRNIPSNKFASRAFRTIMGVMGKIYRHIYKVDGGDFSAISELYKKDNKYITDEDIYDILRYLFLDHVDNDTLKKIAHDNGVRIDFGKMILKNGKFYNWKSTPFFKSTHVGIYINTTRKRSLPKIKTDGVYFLERYTNGKKRESWTFFVFKYPHKLRREDYLTENLVVDDLQRKRIDDKKEEES